MSSGSLLVTGALLDGEPTALRAREGAIAEIGPNLAPAAGEQLLDGAGTAIVPGFVNAHTHAAMTLFRGYADDLPLMEWLERHIWPAEARLTADDVYWGTRLACIEMIRSGTVAFWDMYWHPGATARAAADAGLRATIGAPLIDGDDSAGAAKLRDDAEAGLAELGGAGPGISAALAPHAIYSVSGESLRWIGERSRELELPIQIHLAETEREVLDCLDRHGARPAAYLAELGLLGPRTLLAHSVWLDDAERELIAEAGATVVSNPNANLKLAVGAIFDLDAAAAAGIAVGLGTDGAGSNNSLSMLAEVKQLALLQKHRAGNAAAAPAAEALAIARGERSALLGGAGLEVGAPADFLLARLDSPALAVGAIDAGLAYTADVGAIDATVVGGRVLMRGGALTAGDEGEVVARVRECAGRLGLV